MTNYGGITVTDCTTMQTQQALAQGAPYGFERITLQAGEALTLSNLGFTMLYVQSGDVNINNSTINAGESLTTGKPLELHSTKGCTAFVATAAVTEPVATSHQKEHYTVTKPWGRELWLSGADCLHFTFKVLEITQGNQCSLQYHEEKRETLYLASGNMELVYHQGPQPAPADLATLPLNQPTAMDVVPPAIHRFRAVSNIVLIEAATPQIDDVVRLADDSNRPSGRINAEHEKHVGNLK